MEVATVGQFRSLGTHSNQSGSAEPAQPPVSGNILQGGSRRCAQGENLFCLLDTEEKGILLLSKLGRPSVGGFYLSCLKELDWVKVVRMK